MRYNISKLGTTIKAARQNKKLTQIQLAEQLNISPRHLQSIENENKTPSYDLLARILDCLDIPVESVICPEDSNTSLELDRLIYLLKYKCTEQDIRVLIAAAEALVKNHQ